MKLKRQLAELAKLGLKLNDGVTIDDLLFSHDEEEFEDEPFDLILFVLGCNVENDEDDEAGERHICSRAWNLDMECIDGTGSYVRMVKRLCVVAGQPGLITNIEDLVNFAR